MAACVFQIDAIEPFFEWTACACCSGCNGSLIGRISSDGIAIPVLMTQGPRLQKFLRYARADSMSSDDSTWHTVKSMAHKL